jgi:hypothetical protein
MNVPQGRLRRQRVVADPATPLERVLETELTGYARLQSQDELLLDSEGVGVLTFEDGVPILAYHTGTDRGGTAALTDIAVAGPYRVSLYEVDPDALAAVHEESTLQVEPGGPAEHLAGDSPLAERTRERAPTERLANDTEETDTVSAFLDNEERIAEVQEAARHEAQRRATDWGFDTESP